MTFYVSPPLKNNFREDQFDLKYWLNEPNSKRLKGGRGASQKIEIAGQHYVLRRYLRGGFVAKFIYDRFFWWGDSRARPVQECFVLNYAKDRGLSVPACAAYQVQRSGLFYRAAIVSEYLENEGTLADVLNKKVLTDVEWQQLAKEIKTMHKSLINHADLNADNILVHKHSDFGHMSFSIIDFDKARIEKNNKDWPEKNNARLYRSLNKLKPQFFDSLTWEKYLSFYNAED